MWRDPLRAAIPWENSRVLNCVPRYRIRAFVLCSLSVVLMQDGAEDKQKSKQPHAVNVGISLVGLCQEEHGAAVQSFDDKRKAECKKERVAGLLPELQKEDTGGHRRRRDDAEQECFERTHSASHIRPYSRSSIDTAAVARRDR